MWKWDQGRMGYFQFDALRIMASFLSNYNFRNSEPAFIREQTGLPFSAPATHSPWRNYARIYKLCLLVSGDGNAGSRPTDVAYILAKNGVVTCDEYLHFLVEATTDPSPALVDWKSVSSGRNVRHPLCFSLKYLLAKVAGLNEYVTSIDEVIGAYVKSGYSGDESDTAFLKLLPDRIKYESTAPDFDFRQARESLKFITQISYLHSVGKDMVVSLHRDDASDIFHALNPIGGLRNPDGDQEILRLASLFSDGSDHSFFDYKNTVVPDVRESGFVEGDKVKKTHMVIERNSRLRGLFFQRHPGAVCDACHMDTRAKYSWVDRVLDLHHLLPLASGTRVDYNRGTMLDDLVPVCPTCHRAIHRYYDSYLNTQGALDFADKREALDVYWCAKGKIKRGDCYVC